MKLTIAKRIFASKEQAKMEISELLHQHEPGQVVASEHWGLLHGLLERHPRAEEKMGCGVAAFFVDRDSYGSQCFWVLRRDGSREHFSFREALRPATYAEIVASAFREEVVSQVLAFKTKNFVASTFPCALTGEPVTWNTSHVDHVRPFKSLLADFLQQEGLQREQIAWEEFGVGVLRLRDRALASRWQEFHQQHAVLRITSPAANLKRPREV